MQSEPNENLHSDPEGEENSAESPEPSKSQRKREADEIRDFARLLTTLPSTKLKRLSLPEDIVDAIRKCPPPATRGAHKRHLMFISKLLRKTARTDEWRAQLENPARPNKGTAHESMRDKLIEAFANHVDHLRQHYPAADLQRIRQLVRQINAAPDISAEDRSDSDIKQDDIEISKQAARARTKAKNARKVLLKLLRDTHESDQSDT